MTLFHAPLQRIVTPHFIALLLFCQGSTGCMQWYSDSVGTGVARLSVRNIGTMLTALTQDETCGFASDKVHQHPTIDGEIGTVGTVTWRTENCHLHYDKLIKIKENCSQGATYASGSIQLTAEKIIRGHITGDPKNPVVPENADAVRFHIINAAFDNFLVQTSTSKKALKMISGSLRASVQPRMAAHQQSHACAVATPNLHITDIVYDKALVHVFTPERDFDVPIQTSNFYAYNGVYKEHENHLAGTITVWDNQEIVPEDGDTDGLDPDYNAVQFRKDYACTKHLKNPHNFACNLKPRLGQATAQLSIRTLGALLQIAAQNSDCGFAAPNVKNQFRSDGPLGSPDGRVVYEMAPCNIDFATLTTLHPSDPERQDCREQPVITQVKGTATLSGTKTLQGYLTSDPQAPLVAASDLPATLYLQAELDNFTVHTSNSANTLTIQSGKISGRISPKTLLNTKTGACTHPSPHAAFNAVTLNNAQVQLHLDGKQFNARIEKSLVNAVHGKIGTQENNMHGSITIDSHHTNLPLDTNQPELDPNYHAQSFREAYNCWPHSQETTQPVQCSFKPTLGQTTARLITKTMAMLVKAVDDNELCGFAAPVTMASSEFTPIDNGLFMAETTVKDCIIGGDNIFYTEDCVGNRYYFNGIANLRVRRHVRGQLVANVPLLHPQSREDVKFVVESAYFENFSVQQLPPGDTQPKPYLVIHDGILTGIAKPITGEAADSPGAYIIKTPVAGFEQLSLQKANATLHSGPKVFKIFIDDSNIAAFNGSYRHQTNALSGVIILDGQRVDLPIDRDQRGLNPEFTQQEFNKTYACKNNLKETVPQGYSL